MQYTIFCILPDGNSAFPVDIEDTKTVGHLKKEVKAEKQPELDDFAANALTLYHIDVDISNKKEYIEKVNRVALDLGSLKELEVGDTLVEVFASSPPSSRKIHILVIQPPRGESTYCGGVVLMAGSVDATSVTCAIFLERRKSTGQST
jgi:hypothetical protein